MKTAIATLKSCSPYSQSSYHKTPALEKETKADYEARTWRNKCNLTEDDFVYIPPMAFKNCISETAKYLSMQVPGKGKATYTKYFESGVLVTEPLVLPIKKDDVKGEWLFVPSSGRRGDGSRVEKCFPIIHEWRGQVSFLVLEDAITEKVFAQHLDQAGKFIGIGRFRPRNNGFYGRFIVESVDWS